MSPVLIDTSALAKTVIDEPESDALAVWLDEQPTSTALVVSSLAVVELRRMVIRWGLPHELVTEALRGVAVVPVTEPILHHSGVLPHAYLRTLDAIHLATALAIEATTVLTYDDRLAEAALAEGVFVASPS